MGGNLKESKEEWIIKMEERANQTEKFIKELCNEIEEIKSSISSNNKIESLREENANLINQIEEYKSKLAEIERANGIKQVPLPAAISAGGDIHNVKCSGAETPNIEAKSSEIPIEENVQKKSVKPEKNSKKEQKVIDSKKSKENKGNTPTVEEPPVDVGRLDFRVGKIVAVKKHPDADSLYVEEIDVGEGTPRTVVSGLVKHVPIEEMQNRMVVLLCNLKPAKMRGITSQAMVMCASSPEAVEILQPPSESVPGDEVHVEGYPRLPDSVLNPKKKIFESVAPELKTNDKCIATYKGVAWTVPGKGVISTKSLVGVNIK